MTDMQLMVAARFEVTRRRHGAVKGRLFSVNPITVRYRTSFVQRVHLPPPLKTIVLEMMIAETLLPSSWFLYFNLHNRWSI